MGPGMGDRWMDGEGDVHVPKVRYQSIGLQSPVSALGAEAFAFPPKGPNCAPFALIWRGLEVGLGWVWVAASGCALARALRFPMLASELGFALGGWA